MEALVASKERQKKKRRKRSPSANDSEYALDEISHKKGKAVDDSDAGGGLTSLFSLVDAAHVTKGTESALGVINSGAAKAVRKRSREASKLRVAYLLDQKKGAVRGRQMPANADTLAFSQKLHPHLLPKHVPTEHPHTGNSLPAPSFSTHRPLVAQPLLPAASAPTFPTSPRLTKMIGVYDPAWRKIRLERWRQKRSELVFDSSRIQYPSRSSICAGRKRVNGRFVEGVVDKRRLTKRRLAIGSLGKIRRFRSRGRKLKVQDAKGSGLLDRRPTFTYLQKGRPGVPNCRRIPLRSRPLSCL